MLDPEYNYNISIKNKIGHGDKPLIIPLKLSSKEGYIFHIDFYSFRNMI